MTERQNIAWEFKAHKKRPSVHSPTAAWDVCSPSHHKRPGRGLWSLLQPEAMATIIGCTVPGLCIDVCSLSYHQRLCGGLWHVMQPEVMCCLCSGLPPMVSRGFGFLPSRGHVCGLRCSQKPWAVLPLTVKIKEDRFVMISMTADTQFRGRDLEGPLTTGTP